jgi:ABC-type nickel/cobalt efflux system permease component RcnA
MARLARGTLLALACLALVPLRGEAHPLGNFSINHHSALRLAHAGLELIYVIDMAEIPAFQEMQEHGLVADPAHATVTSYMVRRASTLRDGLEVELDGRRLPLVSGATAIAFPEGAGGLPTLRLVASFRASWPEPRGHVDLRYRDTNFAERAGWKEIVAEAAAGVALQESTAAAHDRSRRLSAYPEDLLQSPPQQVEARVRFAIEAPSVASAAPPVKDGLAGVAPRPRVAPAAIGETPPRPLTPARTADDRRDDPPPTPAVITAGTASQPLARSVPRDAFAALVTAGEPSVSMLLLTLAIAAGLGAVHALEPGHGKTVVAAYLVGSRGTAAHALWLGLIVTASHTAGVYLLGGIVLYASRHVVPEQLYPWLGAASGVMIAGVGAVLFLRRLAGEHDHHHADHEHGHGHHGHEHAHGDHHHSHGSSVHHHHVLTGDVSARQLVALGVSGGIVPCPGALVVLLAALAFGRVGLGLLLITAFSVGLAAVLVAIGLLMVHAGRVMARFHGNGPLVTRWVPLASAAVVAVLGVGVAIRSLVSA